MQYEKLLREAEQQEIYIYEKPMKPNIKGLYSDSIICINKNIPTRTEKACTLAEEIGHYHTSVGDITDQGIIENRKQELHARQWAYNKLIPLERIIDAYKSRIKGRHEIAEFLDVTEDFLQAAIDRYRDKYGLHVIVDDRYIIYFEPLGVVEMFDI
jgi:hypothetical protein